MLTKDAKFQDISYNWKRVRPQGIFEGFNQCCEIGDEYMNAYPC